MRYTISRVALCFSFLALWNGEALAERVVIDDGRTIENFEGQSGLTHSQYYPTYLHGGVLENKNGSIGTVGGVFSNNVITSYDAWGAAVANEGHIDRLEGVYRQNVVGGNQAVGGAVANSGTIGTVDASFIENLAIQNKNEKNPLVFGGALHNSTSGKINTVKGEFRDNKAYGEQASGGALSNNGIIEEIEADFSGNVAALLNYDINRSLSAGGAIYSNGVIGTLKGNFDNNRTAGFEVLGGAVMIDEVNNENAPKADKATVISGDFTGNEADGAYIAAGGAIAYWGDDKGKSNGLDIVNSNFYNNKASTIYDNVDPTRADGAMGGAVFSTGGPVKVTADGEDSVFRGNTANGKSNAIFMMGSGLDQPYKPSGHKVTLELSAKNGGNVIMDDGIDGMYYDLLVSGDGTGSVALNNTVDNVSNFNLLNGSVTRLGKNAVINTENYIADNATLQVDMAVDAANQSVQNGVINVAKDVVGDTTVIVNTENPDTFEGAVTAFLNAQNDDMATASNFNVGRVVGSPYMWDAIRNAKGEEDGSTWYLAMSGTENPDYDDNEPEPGPDPDPSPSAPIFAPEVAAYAGVQQAALEQNRSISDSVSRGLSAEKSNLCYEETCGLAEAIPHKKAWVDATYESADIDAPSDMEADIQGVTAGLDLYYDGIHRAGIFGAYRNGSYDLSGKGDYFSRIGSKIDNESYLGGAYYKYQRDNWAMLATLYAGTQDMDIKTDDRLAFASTDAMQYGASAELAKKLIISDYLNVEPSLGLRYTMLDIDDLTDNVGKTASFDTLHYLEAELGIKLEYLFCRNGCTNRMYIKPSVLRTFSSGGKTRITGIDNDIRSYKDRTLGRLEVGGTFGITRDFSGYAAAGYTFGDDYDAYDVNAGLSYAF